MWSKRCSERGLTEPGFRIARVFQLSWGSAARGCPWAPAYNSLELPAASLKTEEEQEVAGCAHTRTLLLLLRNLRVPFHRINNLRQQSVWECSSKPFAIGKRGGATRGAGSLSKRSGGSASSSRRAPALPRHSLPSHSPPPALESLRPLTEKHHRAGTSASLERLRRRRQQNAKQQVKGGLPGQEESREVPVFGNLLLLPPAL